MKQQDYHLSITTSVTPQGAFEKISRVSQWWAKDFEGKSDEPNDVFTVRFKSGYWYTIKITELIPGEKLVWDVIDADQTWHEDRDEWKGTKIVWEITPTKSGSKVTMTHQGLVPAFECYEKCTGGWDYLIKQSLYKYLTEKKGMPV